MKYNLQEELDRIYEKIVTNLVIFYDSKVVFINKMRYNHFESGYTFARWQCIYEKIRTKRKQICLKFQATVHREDATIDLHNAEKMEVGRENSSASHTG